MICGLQVEMERLHHAKKRGKDLLEAYKQKTTEYYLCKWHKYAMAMNAEGQPSPSKDSIIALLLSQQKIIEWLDYKISEYMKFDFSVEDFSLSQIASIPIVLQES
jgi:hypothetical protein